MAIYRADTGSFVSAFAVGALPDMLTFTPDGYLLLVANEGEPSDDYTVDPEGSISVIDGTRGFGQAQAVVTTLGFTAFNDRGSKLVALGGHFTFFGSLPSVARDLEPEYIAVSADSRTAWVTLQEANCIAIVDSAAAPRKVSQLVPLGVKNHQWLGNGLDASDCDAVLDTGANAGRVNITSVPVFGMYQPDAIASYVVGDQTYLVTANEGDVRDWPGASEAKRVNQLTLLAASLAVDDAVLGRLTVTNTKGDSDGDGTYEALYAFGGRSFSIWSASGNLVFDSGDELEQITAAAFPSNFNASNTSNALDNRSDDKGPEPEGVAIGKVGDRTFAFIGLERIGGVVVYEVTEPTSPRFLQYLNHRDFSVSDLAASVAGDGAVGDLGPEGILFIPASQAPSGAALLIVGNEVSGTTSVYRFALP